jgi:Spy/CpxP family protein refolding chaperone
MARPHNRAHVPLAKEQRVRKRIITIAVGLAVAFGGALAVAQQARPVNVSPATMDEVLKAVRADLQGDRADIMAKNLTLTSGQAAQFWPVFSAYQKEQDAIMDGQLKGIQQYIESFDTLTDTAALGLINAHLDRDTKMVALRQKWMGDFQKALGPKLAVRAMQIDRRLSLVHQLEFAARIPLAH